MSNNDFAFDSPVRLQFQLMDAVDVRQRSRGEVRTHRIFNSAKTGFHSAGLFSPRIFGPVQDWRPEANSVAGRMGHIELPRPVLHPLFRRGRAGRLFRLFLGLSAAELDHLLKGWIGIVIARDGSTWRIGDKLSIEQFTAILKEGPSVMSVVTQSDAIRWLIRNMDVDSLQNRIQSLEFGDSEHSIIRRLREAQSSDFLERLQLQAIPVISPALRPFEFGPSGRARAHGVTRLYQLVLQRCRRLRRLMMMGPPPVILYNESWRLQQAVERLFAAHTPWNEWPKGTSPRISLHRLVRRSAKSLQIAPASRPWPNAMTRPLVANPNLKLENCGLPRTSETLRLFADGLWTSVANHCQSRSDFESWLRENEAEAWSVLESKLPRQAVLLTSGSHVNPLSLMAFQPEILAGDVIQVSPWVASNLASKDGNITAIPLTNRTSCSEAVAVVQSAQSRQVSDGTSAFKPTTEVALGCFLLTRDACSSEVPQHGSTNVSESDFASVDEAVAAYERGAISLHAPIRIRCRRRQITRHGDVDEIPNTYPWIETTAGRVLMNSVFPPTRPFINYQVDRRRLGELLQQILEEFGEAQWRRAVDEIQAIAISVISRTGLSLSSTDFTSLDSKPAVIQAAQLKVARNQRALDRGTITSSEFARNLYEAWFEADQQIQRDLAVDCDRSRASSAPLINLLGVSGGISLADVKRNRGMFGFSRSEFDRSQFQPILTSWGEGLSSADYWLVSRVSRRQQSQERQQREKGHSFRQMLLRGLGDLFVTERDCGAHDGIDRQVDYQSIPHRRLRELIEGRISCETILHPISGEVLIHVGSMITKTSARQIDDAGIVTVRVRSPATCTARRGMCQACYGIGVATKELAEPGDSVGVLAAFALATDAHLQVSRWVYPAARQGNTTGLERCRLTGRVQFEGLKTARNSAGDMVALTGGQIVIQNWRRTERQSIVVPRSARLLVEDGADISPGAIVCEWNPWRLELLAETDGTVQFRDLLRNVNYEADQRDGNIPLRRVLPAWNSLRPRIEVVNEDGHPAQVCFLPDGAEVRVTEWSSVAAGDTLATISTDAGFQPQAVGLEELQSLFLGGPTRNTALLSPCDGILEDYVRGELENHFVIRSDDGDLLELIIPRGESHACWKGDRIRRGQRLTRTEPVNPTDLLNILGEAATIQYLLKSMQLQYQSQGIRVDDRHLELVIGRLLARDKVDSTGDANRHESPRSVSSLHSFFDRGWTQLMRDMESLDGSRLGLAALAGRTIPVDGPAAAALLGVDP